MRSRLVAHGSSHRESSRRAIPLTGSAERRCLTFAAACRVASAQRGQRWQQDAGSPAHGAAPEKDPPMHQLSEHAERLAHYPSPKTGRSIRFESQPVEVWAR